ncbi:hypothetical protein ACFV1N_42520 [Streptosporangium canum]|uniref:hypothetical protein n=1 Tax=Streptosporangium canum TaxID=324952 RepID=UPI0036BEE5E5
MGRISHASALTSAMPLAAILPPAGAPTGLMGTAATAGGLVLTGALLWWYGTVWPRRTLQGPIDTRRSPYGPRRYPGLKI